MMKTLSTMRSDLSVEQAAIGFVNRIVTQFEGQPDLASVVECCTISEAIPYFVLGDREYPTQVLRRAIPIIGAANSKEGPDNHKHPHGNIERVRWYLQHMLSGELPVETKLPFHMLQNLDAELKGLIVAPAKQVLEIERWLTDSAAQGDPEAAVSALCTNALSSAFEQGHYLCFYAGEKFLLPYPRELYQRCQRGEGIIQECWNLIPAVSRGACDSQAFKRLLLEKRGIEIAMIRTVVEHLVEPHLTRIAAPV